MEYTVGTACRKRLDPALVLNPQAMAHVLSFVEPIVMPNVQNESNEKAARCCDYAFGYPAPQVKAFHAQMELMSRSWRTLLLDRGFISQSVDGVGLSLDFDTMSDAFLDRGLAWLKHFKFPIKSVSGGSKRLFVLASKVLKECDTSQLTTGKVQLRLPDDSPAHFQFLLGEGSFSSLGYFLQTLGDQCPKLDHLELILCLNKKYKYQSSAQLESVKELVRDGPALFSHPAIACLKIEVRNVSDANFPIEGAVHLGTNLLSKITETFPNLQALELSSGHRTIVTRDYEGNLTGEGLLISSNSLRILRMINFRAGTLSSVRLSLDCPMLQELHTRYPENQAQIRVSAVHVPATCMVFSTDGKKGAVVPFPRWQGRDG